ncbi:BrnT family toxin [Arhodomonas sp. AD133]|uniref:BrnT family toxin n=1 Tax=Arhodomonas sp. AD133 TaxID=3415009 RepID=UPI003EB93788
MDVEWDPAKAKANQRKHRVSFADAAGVLFDPEALVMEDPDAEDEQRHVALGMDHLGRVLVVVFSYRGEAVRLISARKASPGERRQYEG